jgi:hypothetical protein
MRAIAAAESPSRRESAPPMARQTPAGQSSPPLTQLPAALTPFTPPAISYAPQPSAVQRALVDNATESEAAAAPEINLTELSEQVYAEVRRRLAVEWERGRGRL